MDLVDLLQFENWDDCKIHLASSNWIEHPLNVFVRDREEWRGWNESKGARDVFNRNYIFSLIEFYHEANTWLFGGFFKVVERHDDQYKVQRCGAYEELIGRLKVGFRRPGRNRVLTASYLADMSILEILREPYSGEAFCGYENIDHDFSTLEVIFGRSLPDWKSALENIKGVYLITDKSTGRRYVGAAYGESGVWSRWSAYIGTGHGYTDELTRLIDQCGFDYARNNLKFALLEYRPMKTDDQVLIDREQYWKSVLMTQGEYGLNRN